MTPRHAAASAALRRAVDFAEQSMHADGRWEECPDARIFDTAIVVICLAAVRGPACPEVARGRSWLAGARPQISTDFGTAVEYWLRKTALDADAPPAPARVSAHPGRALLLELVAACAGSPESDLGRLTELAAAAGPRAGLKQWHRALLAAADLIGGWQSDETDVTGLVEALELEQSTEGDFCLMPAVTAIAYTALAGAAPERPSTRRCREYLSRSQHRDGTWRYLSFDIWDTTLMVRSLRGVPAFEPLIEPAQAFIEKTQSADGGWACCRGIESDNDTTSSALLALAGSSAISRVGPAAGRYLRRVQRIDGLWTTWQSADDTPCADVTAHVISAVRSNPELNVEVAEAVDWLVAQHGRDDGWSAQWYPNPAYAVAEIGEAVGWAHPVSRAAARELAGLQRPDGGWALTADHPDSDPAVTGLALTVCVRSGISPPPHVVERAVAYLVQEQTAAGTWQGAPAMAGPRPFLNHLPLHTHAFAAAGLRDFLEIGHA